MKGSPPRSSSTVLGSGTGDVDAAGSAKMRTPKSMLLSSAQGQHDRSRKLHSDRSCADARFANGLAVVPDMAKVVPENAGPELVCERASNESQNVPGRIVQFKPD
jgi:hypothetical protein